MNKLRKDKVFAGRYLLLEQLGLGGFSEVWKAADQMAGGLVVAIKVFAPEKGLDSDDIKIYSQEYSLVFNLKDDNFLLRPSHYDIFKGSPYLVMKYMPNGSAYKKIGNMTENEAMKFLKQACVALDYMHSKTPNIVHQDIKPDNFLIDDNGDYYLTDFGISSKIRRALTQSIGIKHSTSGTQAYMPPEKFSKKLEDRKPKPEGDIWALGATVFELLTGEMPFGELGGLAQMTGAEMPDLPDQYSADIKRLLNLMLSMNINNRPTAAKVLQSLSNEIFGNSKNKKEKQKSEPRNPRITVKIESSQENNCDDLIRKTETEIPDNTYKYQNLARKITNAFQGFSWLYVFALVSFFIGFIFTEYQFHSDYVPGYPFSALGKSLMSLSLCFFTISILFSLVVFYRGWQSIQDGKAYTTPGKAVGYLLIPIFNFYWIFIAFRRLFVEMNKYNPGTKASHKFATFVCIVALIPFVNLLNLIFIPILLAKVRNNTIFICTELRALPMTKNSSRVNKILFAIAVLFVISLTLHVKLKSRNITAYISTMELGDSCLKDNNFEKAILYYNKAKEYGVKEVKVGFNADSRIKEAKETEKQLEYSKYFENGKSYLLKGDFKMAATAFENAVKIYRSFASMAAFYVATNLSKPVKTYQLLYKTESYNNGKYTGYFLDGERHGFGVYDWNDGGAYVGQWKNGWRIGYGVYTYQNGDKKFGYWQKSKEMGKYIYYNKSDNTWDFSEYYVLENFE